MHITWRRLVQIPCVLSKSQFHTVLQTALKCWTHCLADSQSAQLLHICSAVIKKQAGCHLSHRKFSPASTFLWLFGTNYLFTCLRIHQSALNHLKLLLELFLFKFPLVCIDCSSPAAPVCETLPWTPVLCLTWVVMFRPGSCLFFICVFPIKAGEPGGRCTGGNASRGSDWNVSFIGDNVYVHSWISYLALAGRYMHVSGYLKFLFTSCWSERKEASWTETTGE